MPLISKVPLLSAKVFGERILILVRKKGSLSLAWLNKNLEVEEEMVTLQGFQGFILDAQEEAYLLAIDDQLIALRHGELKPVLKAHPPSNFFWHAVRKGDSIYIQEYGLSPTGLWLSTKDYEDLRLLINNLRVDRGSKHFHNIVYDPFRDWLIATLGDGNAVRVVVSQDEGRTWLVLYKGAWQFIPIVTLKNRIVFGMDSGIAKGGIGVYHPADDRWGFTFLRLCDENAKSVQMCDLKQLSDGIWIAALGTPQAIVFSRDLKIWYAVHIEGFNKSFNHHMTVSEGKDFVVCSTGKSLLLFMKSELESSTLKAQPVIVSYGAYIDRLKGYGFTLKRKLSGTWLVSMEKQASSEETTRYHDRL